jgi:hypothetical protein
VEWVEAAEQEAQQTPPEQEAQQGFMAAAEAAEARRSTDETLAQVGMVEPELLWSQPIFKK